MPYIDQGQRSVLDSFINNAIKNYTKTPGALNYVITTLCHGYYKNNGANYQALNDIVGALEGCKLEFYRRVAAPYEDKKIAENGDV